MLKDCFFKVYEKYRLLYKESVISDLDVPLISTGNDILGGGMEFIFFMIMCLKMLLCSVLELAKILILRNIC